jgi:hypothetical protein
LVSCFDNFVFRRDMKRLALSFGLALAPGLAVAAALVGGKATAKPAALPTPRPR